MSGMGWSPFARHSEEASLPGRRGCCEALLGLPSPLCGSAEIVHLLQRLWQLLPLHLLQRAGGVSAGSLGPPGLSHPPAAAVRRPRPDLREDGDDQPG